MLEQARASVEQEARSEYSPRTQRFRHDGADAGASAGTCPPGWEAPACADRPGIAAVSRMPSRSNTSRSNDRSGGEPAPRIVVADTISPHELDRDARRVITRLQHHGHEAYFVGGCVRDLWI